MAADALFGSVVTLLHLNGADASTTITDVKGGTWTAAGGPTISTTTNKWGGASARLPDTGSITGPTTAFGTSDFCIELWARADTGALTNRTLFSNGYATGFEIWINGGGSLVVAGLNGSLISVAGPANIVVANVWNHYALTRSGDVFRLFFNGVQHSTVTRGSTNFTSTGARTFGGLGASPVRWVGYIDDVRITSVPRYTANFAVPTEAFADSQFGEGGPLFCPMPMVAASGTSIIPSAVTEIVSPKMRAVGYGAANADVLLPALRSASGGGGTLTAVMPGPEVVSAGRDPTGDAAFIFSIPKLEAVGYGGASATLTTPAYTCESAGTVTIVGSTEARMPAALVAATGTVATAGSGSPATAMPMATLVGYGGAVLETTLTGGYPVSATGLTGATGLLTATLPLYELVASGTARDYGRAAIVMPALAASTSGAAYLIAPGFQLTAIGTATIAVTYEAYALNLNHASRRQGQEINDELTRFTNYPFTHVVRHQNSYFGVNSTGLYLLEGTTDFASPPTAIPYNVKTKLTDFGSDQKKTPEAAVFGGRLGPDATVTVFTGETEDDVYAYTTPRGQDVQNYRQKFGKGLKARYYAFGIQGSGAMALDTVSFDIAELKRRI